MVNEIKDLKTFVRYCKNQIDAQFSKETEVEIVLNKILLTNITDNELMENVVEVFEMYYRFLGIAEKKEEYENCAIIYESLLIEQKHFKNIAKKCNFKLDDEIKEIDDHFKKKFIVQYR